MRAVPEVKSALTSKIPSKRIKKFSTFIVQEAQCIPSILNVTSSQCNSKPKFLTIESISSYVIFLGLTVIWSLFEAKSASTASTPSSRSNVLLTLKTQEAQCIPSIGTSMSFSFAIISQPEY